jgi:hypothetical protein
LDLARNLQVSLHYHPVGDFKDQQEEHQQPAD